jgi:hypothetical protein
VEVVGRGDVEVSFDSELIVEGGDVEVVDEIGTVVMGMDGITAVENVDAESAPWMVNCGLAFPESPRTDGWR